MDNWIRVVQEKDILEGTVTFKKVDGRSLILLKVAGTVYALLNQCPHLGCAMHRGELSGYFLSCPCHQWIFDVRSGEFTAAPEIKIPTYPVRVDDGEILINVGGDHK